MWLQGGHIHAHGSFTGGDMQHAWSNLHLASLWCMCVKTISRRVSKNWIMKFPSYCLSEVRAFLSSDVYHF